MKLLSRSLWEGTVAVVIALLFAELWLRGEHYAARARAGETLLKGAIAVGNANAEIARTQASLASRINAVAAVNAIKKRTLRTTSDTRRKAIIRAPMDTDGPLAPILRDQLDRLPEPPGADPRHNIGAAGDSVFAPVEE